MNTEYPFTIEPQEPSGFVVQFLDFEEAFTEGATIEECIFNAQEVLTGIIEQRMVDNDELPAPSGGPCQYRVAPAALGKRLVLSFE